MNKVSYKKVVVIATIFIALIGLVLVCFVPIAQAVEPTNLEIKIGGEGQVTGITEYIILIYKFASGIVAGLAAVMIVIGGVQYATAAGNPKGIASAKETIISAIIGLVIVGAGYLILGLFGTQFTTLKEPGLPETPSLPASGQDGGDTAPRYKCANDGEGGGTCERLTTEGKSDTQCRSTGQSCTYTPALPERIQNVVKEA